MFLNVLDVLHITRNVLDVPQVLTVPMPWKSCYNIMFLAIGLQVLETIASWIKKLYTK